jgi:hypothetical protein
MKKIFFILVLLPNLIFAQYSNYYNIDINSKSKVDANINVTGNINKTITNIDYGMLGMANAQMEKNRIESQMYANEIEKKQALEIATNPIKAFDYGLDNNWVMEKNDAAVFGFSKGTTWYHKIPNKSLFAKMDGYSYRNESSDNVITEIELGSVTYLFGTKAFKSATDEQKAEAKKQWAPFLGNTEAYTKAFLTTIKLGKNSDSTSSWNNHFIHKKEIKKAKIYGVEGFIASLTYENDYEFVIKDNYFLILPNGISVNCGVRYRGDKDKIDFEKLEGRRNYLKRLADQIIATANFSVGKQGLLD